jgi:hypothetical protein
MEQLKVDILNDAYSKIRISGLTVTPNPSDLELSLNRLEAIMSELDVRGISLGYNFEDDPDPNSNTNLPKYSFDGISSLLATRLIPDFNKVVPPQLMLMSAASMCAISGKAARDRLNKINYPERMPIGSGNRFWPRWSRFYYPSPIPPVDSIRMLVGETNSYISSFEQFLNDGETISSFTIDSSSGITINSSSIVGNTINYSVSATLAALQTVTITITTSDARVLPRVISIEVDQPAEVA